METITRRIKMIITQSKAFPLLNNASCGQVSMLVLTSADNWHIQLSDFVIYYLVDLEINPPGLSPLYINYININL